MMNTRVRARRPVSHAIQPLEGRRLLATVPTGFTDAAHSSTFGNGTAMTFAPDGRLFTASQDGVVRVIQTNGTTTTANTIPVAPFANTERGLLGIEVDPNFATNNYLYVYYTTTAGGTHNRISRFTMTGDTFTLASEQVLVDLENLSGATNHNGGAIEFGPDGKLYVAVGDNANGGLAQSATSRFGKILRYNADGTIPGDNPTTIAGIGATSGIYRAVWAAGLRNPYTFSFNSVNGQMFINDVGQGSWEEINLGQAGKNYGWPATEGYFTPAGATANFTSPYYAYEHGSGNQRGFSITGGTFYNSTGASAFPKQYQGDYFFGEFVSNWIGSIPSNAAPGALPHSTAPNFATGASGIVDIEAGPDGRLYYLQRGGTQGVRRITATPTAFPTMTFRTAGFGALGTSATPATTLLLDGGPITTGDGASQHYTENVAVNTSRRLEAPLTQTFNGQTYQFQSWSNGGSRLQTNLLMLNTPTTYTATYKDITLPTVTGASFNRGRDTPSSPPHTLVFNFSEGVATSAPTLTLENLATGVTTNVTSPPALINGQTTLRYSFFGVFPNGELPNGRYRAVFNAGGVADAAGNALGAAFTYNFVALAGDADGDGAADFDDLLLLAANYGTTGKTYAQGNFDMSADGSVNFDDLLVLAANYGTTLPAAAAADPLVSLNGGRKRSTIASDVVG